MVAPVVLLAPVAMVFARAVATRVAVAVLYNAPRVVPAAAAIAPRLDGHIRMAIDRGTPLVAFLEDLATNMFERMAENAARDRRNRFHSTLRTLVGQGGLGAVYGATEPVELRETANCPLRGQGYDREIPSAMLVVGDQPYMVCLTGRRSRLVVIMRVGANEHQDHWLTQGELPHQLRALVNRMTSYLTVRFGHPSQAE